MTNKSNEKDLNLSENQIVADLYEQDIDLLDQVETIVIRCSGPNQAQIHKTFSITLPRDLNITKQHLSSLFSELQSAWSEKEPHSPRKTFVEVDIEFDKSHEKRLLELARETIVDDKAALLNYIVNKILSKKVLDV